MLAHKITTTLFALLISANAAWADPSVPTRSVIAHRGASYDCPESTACAYKLASKLGVDFLELDLQRTKDGHLIAFHDDTLENTTDVAKKFPGREKHPVSSFTLNELKQLDAGSWFNAKNPSRARSEFVGLKILTLDEVINISLSSPNKPGLYIETKNPSQFPGIEKQLAEKLMEHGLYVPGRKQNGKIFLQTFEAQSMALLKEHMPELPKTFLLWHGKGYMENMSDYDKFLAEGQKPLPLAQGERRIDGAVGAGPDYEKLLEPEHLELIKRRGMFAHVYTVNDSSEFAKIDAKFKQHGIEKTGYFTDRPDLLLDHWKRSHITLADAMNEVLSDLRADEALRQLARVWLGTATAWYESRKIQDGETPTPVLSAE